MRQTWRWFGPRDVATIDDMLQSGVEGVVSALHHVRPGAVWTPGEIARRQREIATRRDGGPSGLAWEVVESLPVSEDVKRQSGEWRAHVEAWTTSLGHLADAGIRVVCYNFMPVLDWTRTALHHPLPHGGTCLRFDWIDFVAFDLHVLERPGAHDDYSDADREAAAARHAAMPEETRRAVAQAVTAGLPGDAETMGLADVRAHLERYAAIGPDRLRANLVAFLEMVTPAAERLGMRLCCHPDDPPFPLLGLPRILSTEDDFRRVLDAVDSPANGMTLCSGSLGARRDNDVPGIMRRLGGRVHFLHLRNVRRESDAASGSVRGSFHESEHLDGDVDMVALVAAALDEEAARRAAGRGDAEIPFRPDHGHDILTDIGRGAQPGYPIAGRMRGLAELRGVVRALAHPAATGRA
ncbi:mannonate dehydratase [Salinarimonas ramus]|uniref:Mannonate dehydratase n=1 Tax=Salinarimonas ramus TaxID=690164 RepID=A0A917QAS0_9HYPH|nr:mannonate dehydratase [Salinarimonas ramus]GGK39605.1 mannonate dehydratase [Salinarimonas ramus]